MEQFDKSEFKVPSHFKPVFNKAKENHFKILREPVRLDRNSDEFVYGYSFKRDREHFQYKWSSKFPFRQRRHLMKIGKASGDPQDEVRGQFPKRDQEGELYTRSVPEHPQIEVVIYVKDAYDCEQRFHDYIRAFQYLGGAGTEFFYTNSSELLRFCRIWMRNRNRAERMAKQGNKDSKQHMKVST